MVTTVSVSLNLKIFHSHYFLSFVSKTRLILPLSILGEFYILKYLFSIRIYIYIYIGFWNFMKIASYKLQRKGISINSSPTSTCPGQITLDLYSWQALFCDAQTWSLRFSEIPKLKIYNWTAFFLLSGLSVFVI